MKINYIDVLKITDEICNDWNQIKNKFNKRNYFESLKIVEREWSSSFIKKISTKNIENQNYVYTNAEMQVLLDKKYSSKYKTNDIHIKEWNYLDGLWIDNLNNLNIFEFKYSSIRKIKRDSSFADFHYDVARSLLFMEKNSNISTIHFLNTTLVGEGETIDTLFVPKKTNNLLSYSNASNNSYYEKIDANNQKCMSDFFVNFNKPSDFFDCVLSVTDKWIDFLEKDCYGNSTNFLYYFVIIRDDNEKISGLEESKVEETGIILEKQYSLHMALLENQSSYSLDESTMEKIDELSCERDFNINLIDDNKIYFFNVFNYNNSSNLKASSLLSVYRDSIIQKSINRFLNLNNKNKIDSEKKIIEKINQVNKYFKRGKNIAFKKANNHSITNSGYIIKDKIAEKMIFICLSFLAECDWLENHTIKNINEYIDKNKNKIDEKNKTNMKRIGNHIFDIALYFKEKYSLEIDIFSNLDFCNIYNSLKKEGVNFIKVLESDDEEELNMIKRILKSINNIDLYKNHKE